MVGNEFMVRKEFTVHRKRASIVNNRQYMHDRGCSSKAASGNVGVSWACVPHGVHSQKRVHGRKRVYCTIEKTASVESHMQCVIHIGCSSKAASDCVKGIVSLPASRSSRWVKSSWSEKSSWYNRKEQA